MVADADKQQLRTMLVPAMITLSAKSEKTLRAQVAETVSIIAGYEFPERWDGLVKVCQSFNDAMLTSSDEHIGTCWCAQTLSRIIRNQSLGA